MRRSTGIDERGAPEIQVTRMRRRHLKGIMAIERQVYPRPWSANLFLAEMRNQKDRAYFVALLDREVVGYGGLLSYGDEAHVTTIAVHPDHQRRKIGTRLLIELLEQAGALDAVAVSLEVRVTNHAAQRMYGRFGFRPIGVRKNYYQEIGEDALVMWTDDIRTEAYRRILDGIRGSLPEELRAP